MASGGVSWRGDVPVRVFKYLFEGLAVAVVALIMGGLSLAQTVALASTAAAAFAILDLMLPAVCVTGPSREGRAA